MLKQCAAAAVLFLSLCSTLGAAEVEIYGKGGRGSREDPFKSGFWASFSCRIDGIECTNLGPVFTWEVRPSMIFRFTDTPNPIFHLPRWKDPTRFQVFLDIETGPARGRYGPIHFWAAAEKIAEESENSVSNGEAPPVEEEAQATATSNEEPAISISPVQEPQVSSSSDQGTRVSARLNRRFERILRELDRLKRKSLRLVSGP